ncbi:MAG: MFS transporter [Minwuiales bacterium]|nr:MFS transporter [Minwuiales bacterium]
MAEQSTWRTPTLILICGSMIVLLTLGTRNSFGLFLEPISHALGTGRGMFGLGLALQNLIWGAAQPFAGAIADRYGPGRVIAAGGVLYALGLLLMSQATDPFTLNIGAGVLIGFGLGGASLAVVLAAVAKQFPEERRSWALGVGTAMGSLGNVVMVAASDYLIGSVGWSLALLAMAAMTLTIVPLSAALAGKPDLGAGVREQTFGEALAEARAHSGYRYLTVGFFVCGFHVVFIGTHFPAYLTDLEFSREVGAQALILIGVFNVIGSYLAGIVGARYSKKYALTWIYLARSVAILLFITLPPSIYTVYGFSAAIGLLWLSTVPLTSGIVAQVFGPRYMATLFGIVFFSHQVGSFLGAWLGGVLYDSTGSYDVVWWASVALGLIAALLHWPIDERPMARDAVPQET